MKISVGKASDWNYRVEAEIDTLEQLLQFVRDHGKIIVEVEQYGDTAEEWQITIYDDWME